MVLCKYEVSTHEFLNARAMSTKYVESEAQVMSLVLIEGVVGRRSAS